MQDIKTEYEARFNKEREEAKTKFEDMKTKYVSMCMMM
jgi:hypothetical protein